MAGRIVKALAINAQAGRYQIYKSDGSIDVVSATSDDMNSLYRKLVDLRLALARNYVGYGWISPNDYARFPITTTVSAFL